MFVLYRLLWINATYTQAALKLWILLWFSSLFFSLPRNPIHQNVISTENNNNNITSNRLELCSFLLGLYTRHILCYRTASRFESLFSVRGWNNSFPFIKSQFIKPDIIHVILFQMRRIKMNAKWLSKDSSHELNLRIIIVPTESNEVRITQKWKYK